MRFLDVLRRRDGFSLIEMVMIIVVVGILLPVVLMPFMQSAKSIDTGPGVSRLVYVARANMASEMETVDTTWPTVPVGSGGAYTKAAITETLDGVTYSTIASGQFMDSAFVNTDGQNPNNKYLWITVTTTDSKGGTLTLTALKTKNAK